MSLIRALRLGIFFDMGLGLNLSILSAAPIKQTRKNNILYIEVKGSSLHFFGSEVEFSCSKWKFQNGRPFKINKCFLFWVHEIMVSTNSWYDEEELPSKCTLFHRYIVAAHS